MAASLESQSFSNFINAVKSLESRRTYSGHIVRFLRYLCFQSTDDLIKLTGPEIEQKIISYIVHMVKNKLATGTIDTFCGAIFTFYEMNDIIAINKKKIKRYIPEKQKKFRDRSYTREEIAKLLNTSDLRFRTIVLTLSSTGIRIGALSILKLRDIRKVNSTYRFTIYENTKDEYFTSCTPECAEAIDQYLDFRKRMGEPLNPDSPLIREEFDINNLGRIVNPKHMTVRGLISFLRSNSIKAGIRVPETLTDGKKVVRKSVMLCHGFRKFTDTQMVESRMDGLKKEMMLGHDIGLEKSYYRPKDEDVLAEYDKAINNLTINEENRLKIKVEKLEVEASQLQRLQAAVKALEMKIK
jgi:integrase